ncbi:MAG: hypothetical protein IKX78_02925 [Clostridia bacterium]|nr:hypothetical protein [Clostridia bacterium]
MLRIYIEDAAKNIKSHIVLSVFLVLIFIFLITVLGLSFAWGNLYVLGNDSGDASLRSESFLNYSVYVLKSRPGIPSESPVKTVTYSYNPDDPENPMVNELSDEEKAHNEGVVASYKKLSSAIDGIKGLTAVRKSFSNHICDNGSAYHLSLQSQGKIQYSYAEFPDFYLDLGYTLEQIERFCNYYTVKYDIDTIMFENFSCCEGRVWTEEDLEFEYTVKDGRLPSIPVLLGYDFKGYFNIGDVLKNPEGEYTVKMINEGYVQPGYPDQDFADYVVIGILDKDTVTVNANGMRESLDSRIVVPHIPRTAEYYPDADIASMASEYYMTLNRTQFYVEPDIEEDAVRELSAALSEDTVMGIWLYPEKQSQAVAVYKQINEKRIINYIAIAVSTLVFTFAVIILIIINKSKKSRRDAAIHRLVGGTVRDNVKSIVVEFIIYLLCADVLSHFVYVLSEITGIAMFRAGFSMYLDMGDFRVYLMYPLMLLTDLLIIAAVAAVSYICYSKDETAVILKGKE